MHATGRTKDLIVSKVILRFFFFFNGERNRGKEIIKLLAYLEIVQMELEPGTCPAC